jgi:hypothetical protein
VLSRLSNSAVKRPASELTPIWADDRIHVHHLAGVLSFENYSAQDKTCLILSPLKTKTLEKRRAAGID